jgi:oxygen-independent coproporphyrinogen-3 oxidase
MPGIYIHIPFCKQACYYCDFHFSVSLDTKKDFVKALLRETALQKNFFVESGQTDSHHVSIDTIYFGGGTPSLLAADEITKILEVISTHFNVTKNAEITLEANPDDLSDEKLKSLKAAGINRLSIGVQSFSNQDLKFMNRAHTSKQSLESVISAQDVGFNNITIDLIYGIQTLSNEKWMENLEIAFGLDVPHLSCYSLTIEPRTALADFIKKGKVAPADELKSAEQFALLMESAPGNGFEQYEISNFAKNNMISLHNSNYWRNEKYLGLGPSAHSYNGTSRQWNISNNRQYIRSILGNKIPFESEELNTSQRYNEYILTSLRTKWGCNLEAIRMNFGEPYADHFTNSMNQLKDKNWIQKQGDVFVLSKAGKFFADKIAAELFK